jgi:predicted PurR-regulated permease PerM
MLIVGLFDGVATSIVYAIAGVPHVGLWAVITGSLALVPFLGYLAVAALTLQLVMTGAATPALIAFGLGCVVLFCGDKIVRPMVARDGTHLRFVWVLMGCLGGFEALGPAGLVIGPVLLALTRELWQQRAGDSAPPNGTDPTAPAVRSILTSQHPLCAGGLVRALLVFGSFIRQRYSAAASLMLAWR